MNTDYQVENNEFEELRYIELMTDEDNFELISFLNQRFLLTPEEVINSIYNNQ